MSREREREKKNTSIHKLFDIEDARLVLVSHGENDRKAAADDQNQQFHGTKLSAVVVRLDLGKNVYGSDEEKGARTEQHGQTGRIHGVGVTDSLEDAKVRSVACRRRSNVRFSRERKSPSPSRVQPTRRSIDAVVCVYDPRRRT